MGWVWGLGFRAGRAERLAEDADPVVAGTRYDYLWMHFSLSDHRARRFIETFAALPEAARTLLLSSETRLQIHLTDPCSYGIFPDIEKDFAGETLGAGRLAFWLDGRHLITVRHHPLRIADEVRGEAEAGAGSWPTPADLAVRLNERFVEVVEDRLAALTRALDRIEDVVLSDRDDVDQAGLGPVRRELSRYHREFAALRGALGRANNHKGHDTGACLLAPHLPALAQAAEDFDRDAAALADRARLLYEEMDTRIAARTNRSLSTLTILSTLLLPPTFIAGAFGMNVPTIPWANSTGGFWFAVLLCVVVVGVSYAVLKRMRIL